MAMNFLQLQQELQMLTLDDSTDFAAWGTKNKVCVNRGYEECWLECLNDESVRQYLASSPQVSMMPINKVANLPSDFFRMLRVAITDFSVDSQVEALPEFFDYEVRWNSALSLFQFILQYQTNITFYYRYIPKRVDMTSDIEFPKLPDILQRNIADYALVHYYRLQKDPVNMSQALQDARFRLSERLEQFLTVS